MGKFTSIPRHAAADVSAAMPRRRREVLRDLKLELLGALSGEERTSGCNPYDSKLGITAVHDVWSQRRRA